MRAEGWAVALALSMVLLGGCERGASTGGAASGTAAAPTAGAAGAPAAASTGAAGSGPGGAPLRQALGGPPRPALLVTQAQFFDKKTADGKTQPIPGAAKLTIVRKLESGWQPVILEDPDSNAFHKAIAYDGGILTIGAMQAMLKVWHFADGAWRQETRWRVKFGGKFDRLRDIERGDVDGDRKDDLVIATHDQGVIAVVHPEQDWRVDEIDRQPDTFVHEIELGDVDGDGVEEIFATPSKPNKLDQEQPGEVTMYRYDKSGWQRSVVDAPGDTHAKEILTADLDRNGVATLFVVWEGAVGQGGALVRPVTIEEYKLRGDRTFAGAVVITVPDRQMRATAAGDVNGDGAIDLVAGGLSSGLWLIEQAPDGWKRTVIDAASSGFEHPVHLADLDGDSALEIYAGAEDQHELRRYSWKGGAWAKEVVAPLTAGDITWNITDGSL